MSVLTANVALVSDTPTVSVADVTPVAAALQKQVTRDFGPLWEVDANVSAFDTLESVPVDYWPVILRDDINQPGAAGYHTDDNGQPFSLVQVDNNWPLTASHEVLEMLADPFGSRTIAGAPPPQLAEVQDQVPDLSRVVYLVEVCDPCESGQFAYTVNGITVSDFITGHYYDPVAADSERYSFGGNLDQPHAVGEGGYVSFGDPVTNNWYQIVVRNGVVAFRDLGVLQSSTGKSLRELVDQRVREIRRDENYRTKPQAMAARAGGSARPYAATEVARAKSLRKFVKGLK
jgi:hypothetical protein